VIVLPSGWDHAHQPHPLPLVISPHGRNNFGWGNAAHYWQELPADGPFALVCPDGLSRAHDKASNPLDQPPQDPSLFTYGYPRWIDDLARMPKIVQATLPWLQIDLGRIYVLGSSMGGQETLLLAARYPGPLSAGTGRLAGAAAFDAPCDLATQCAYLTNLPAAHGADPPGVAARMIQEINAKPGSVRGFLQAATFFNAKLQKHMTVAQLLSELPRKAVPLGRAKPAPLPRQARAPAVSAQALLEQPRHDRRQPGKRPDRQALQGNQGREPIRRRQASKRCMGPLLRVRPRRLPQRRATRLQADPLRADPGLQPAERLIERRPCVLRRVVSTGTTHLSAFPQTLHQAATSAC
jgi:pimeloyl-ACP methyl ester carboxylesterase